MHGVSKQLLHVLQDAVQAAKVGFTLLVEPHLDHGVDYTAESYRDPTQAVVDQFHTSRMSVRVTEIVEETASTKTFRFERTDGALPLFQAGQYVNLFVEIDGVKTSRPFTPSSRPGSGFLDVTVKRTPGGFVSSYLLDRVQVGDHFETTGADGHFHTDEITDREELVFLAGGSGITPFMSIIRDLVHRGWTQRIHLLYGCLVPEDVIFAAELERVAEEIGDQFRYSLVISDPPEGYTGLTGLLDGELIRRQVGEPGAPGSPADRSYYVCGSRLMADFCRRELLSLGVPQHRIKLDLNGPPRDITKELGWPAEVSRDASVTLVVQGRGTYLVRAGEPLMNSLERAGIVTPARCRSGACGVCRVQVLSGEVFMPPGTAIRESDVDYGYIHSCVAYPITDLEIKVPG
jgi:ferredoxin-NADP reductase